MFSLIFGFIAAVEAAFINAFNFCVNMAKNMILSNIFGVAA